MLQAVSSGPLYGRPYGGTAILIRKKLAQSTRMILCSERVTIVRIAEWLFLNVYLPCSGTDQRLLLCNNILQELQGVINAYPGCKCLIGGDFNVDLNQDSMCSKDINDFIFRNNMARCDLLYPISQPHTYINEALHLSIALLIIL